MHFRFVALSTNRVIPYMTIDASDLLILGILHAHTLRTSQVQVTLGGE